MFREFKEFAMKGSVIDLAIAVVIGGAFGKIIDSMVNDVIMPPIGLLLGKVDFANLFINLSGQEIASLDAARKAGLPVIAYGAFLNTLISFVIVAIVLFLIVRSINRLKREESPAPVEPSAQEKILAEIRDLLKQRA
ncbi:MAG: large conductance mechanosensitive channel protein MscL [Acidobacteriota bacterium]